MSRKVLNQATPATSSFNLRRLAPSLSTVVLALLAHIPCCGLPVALTAFGGAAAISGLQTLRPWLLLLGAALVSIAIIRAFKPVSCAGRKPMLERGIAVAGLLVLLYSGYGYANDLKSGGDHSGHDHASHSSHDHSGHDHSGHDHP